MSARFRNSGLRENPCDRGLANAARTGKQVRMMQTLAVQRIHQRPEYMLLPYRVSKILRPPFPCEYEIAHK